MSDNLLKIDYAETETGVSRKSRLDIPVATQNPYDPKTSPPDILRFLPPDGTMFGLFSDPYAKMVYFQPKKGNHQGKYWLNMRLEEHSFTSQEIALMNFLAVHRCATRSQIKRAVFEPDTKDEKIKDFLQKSRHRGIISGFSWATPCKDGKKKPLIYGLTRVGVQATELILQKSLPKGYLFQPIEFPPMAGPTMNTFFHDLVANEFYSELKRIDRVISWEKEPLYRLDNGTIHKPNFSVEVIKDIGQINSFWVESIRLTNEWYDYAIKRFKLTQLALENMSDDIKPKRIIILADSDARIPILSKLAEEYMPDAVVRFTTDERLLAGLNSNTFIILDPVTEKLARSPISWLQDGAAGLKASEYFALHSPEVEDLDEFEE
jgi:hypothetical protein